MAPNLKSKHSLSEISPSRLYQTIAGNRKVILDTKYTGTIALLIQLTLNWFVQSIEDRGLPVIAPSRNPVKRLPNLNHSPPRREAKPSAGEASWRDISRIIPGSANGHLAGFHPYTAWNFRNTGRNGWENRRK